eukprot:5869219-Amphidinium_carterae.1
MSQKSGQKCLAKKHRSKINESVDALPLCCNKLTGQNSPSWRRLLRPRARRHRAMPQAIVNYVI